MGWRHHDSTRNISSGELNFVLMVVYTVTFSFSSERRQWSIAMFLGCVALYSCRTVAPLCLAVMAKEFEWNKTQSVSFIIFLNPLIITKAVNLQIMVETFLLIVMTIGNFIGSKTINNNRLLQEDDTSI